MGLGKTSVSLLVLLELGGRLVLVQEVAVHLPGPGHQHLPALVIPGVGVPHQQGSRQACRRDQVGLILSLAMIKYKV